MTQSPGWHRGFVSSDNQCEDHREDGCVMFKTAFQMKRHFHHACFEVCRPDLRQQMCTYVSGLAQVSLWQNASMKEALDFTAARPNS